MDQEQTIDDVQKLRQGLNELPEPVAKPALVIISGLPGTGKSYFSRKLAERLPSVVLESDVLRKRLFLSPTYTAQESHRLFSACYRLIEELLSSEVTVILDATNLVEQHRERLYHIAERLRAKLLIVKVRAPGDIVRKRLQDRMATFDYDNNSDADWGVYQRMSMRDEKISRNHFSVDTSGDITKVIDKIVREAKR